MDLCTTRTYTDALRVPRELLGKRMLQTLGTADMTALVDHMLTSGRKRGGEPGTGLSPRSIQLTLSVLRRAFKDALRDRKIHRTPPMA